MAGQGQHGTRRHGRSATDAPSPVHPTAIPGGTGSPAAIVRAGQTATEPPATATYRSLLRQGLAPDEAANLTAFLCGIPVGGQHWKLGEINRLLFLRALRATGRFTADDGTKPPTPA